jgi:hypothetical protein
MNCVVFYILDLLQGHLVSKLIFYRLFRKHESYQTQISIPAIGTKRKAYLDLTGASEGQ